MSISMSNEIIIQRMSKASPLVNPINAMEISELCMVYPFDDLNLEPHFHTRAFLNIILLLNHDVSNRMNELVEASP
jgi:hypothetical protein